MKSRRALLCVLLALAFALLVPTLALASEPGNDTWYGPEGPLASGVARTALLSSTYGDSDMDFYYFWSSGNGTATVDFIASTDPDVSQSIGVLRTCAGFYDSILDPENEGDLSAEINLTQGLYMVAVLGDAADSPYSLTVTGDTITTVQPPNGMRPLGYVEVAETAATSSKAGARVLKPRYDYDAEIDPPRVVNGRSVADEDWYKFYVTNTSDVWVGSNADAGFRGDIYNTAMTWLGSTNNSIRKLHLAPGTYFVRWRYASRAYPTYSVGVIGSYVTIAPFATLSTPYAPATRAAGAAFTSAGTISPRHTDTPAVSIQAFKLVSGKWVLKKTMAATITDYTASAQKYRAPVSLWAGKWRLRATHRCTRHLPSYSGWRYITVQ